MAPRKSGPFHPECLKSCSQTCSLPSHCHTRSQHVQSRRLGWGCGGGSWACEIPSVLHLDASDELHSVLGQDSSALFPCASSAQRAWLDLSGGGGVWIFSSPTLQVFLQNSKAALTAWPSLLLQPNSILQTTQFFTSL